MIMNSLQIIKLIHTLKTTQTILINSYVWVYNKNSYTDLILINTGLTSPLTYMKLKLYSTVLCSEYWSKKNVLWFCYQHGGKYGDEFSIFDSQNSSTICELLLMEWVALYSVPCHSNLVKSLLSFGDFTCNPKLRDLVIP